eukprot:gnl/Trimastix_PCT/1497.p2 GENE.gnl/Trimastix_PCT/1497~~gnl/Trimastix_PCT/1497.p2  ORF type:complete len:125 (-),score=13.25 gnl/Trimastix_PCT/1497:28-402(-)
MASRKRTGDLMQIAMIGEEDTVTGFLLAGIGNIDHQRYSNYLIVDKNTTRDQIEEAFFRFTRREDIGIIIINQAIADEIRHLLDDYTAVVPTILEIPSKGHTYDSSRDSIMNRARSLIAARAER